MRESARPSGRPSPAQGRASSSYQRLPTLSLSHELWVAALPKVEQATALAAVTTAAAAEAAVRTGTALLRGGGEREGEGGAFDEEGAV